MQTALSGVGASIIANLSRSIDGTHKIADDGKVSDRTRAGGEEQKGTPE